VSKDENVKDPTRTFTAGQAPSGAEIAGPRDGGEWGGGEGWGEWQEDVEQGYAVGSEDGGGDVPAGHGEDDKDENFKDPTRTFMAGQAPSGAEIVGSRDRVGVEGGAEWGVGQGYAVGSEDGGGDMPEGHGRDDKDENFRDPMHYANGGMQPPQYSYECYPDGQPVRGVDGTLVLLPRGYELVRDANGWPMSGLNGFVMVHSSDQYVPGFSWIDCKRGIVIAKRPDGSDCVLYTAPTEQQIYKHNLKRYEKQNILGSNSKEKYNFAEELGKSAKSHGVTKLRESAEKVAKEDLEELLKKPAAQNKRGSVKLIPETSHGEQHGDNVDLLIVQIMSGKLDQNSVICLERKQAGDNLGMSDVITLVNALKHNRANPQDQIKLPEGIENSMIYKDAQLYNAARDKGIKVVGIEGKGLKHGKESPLYDTTREEHMAKMLERISDTGKNVVLVVGDAHKDRLRSELLDQNIEVKIVERDKMQSIAERLTGKKAEISSNNITPAAIARGKNKSRRSDMGERA
jgi:hypothetical protein